MVILKKFGVCIFFLTSVFLITYSVPIVKAYECRTAECYTARQNMNDAQAKANAAENSAKSVSQLIKQIDNEIAVLNAQIAANNAEIKDLNVKISEEERKLNREQSALAELLIDMHLDTKPDTIVILASSDTISEVAERESRQTDLKEKIALAAKKLKEDKAELEAKKASVEAKRATNEKNKRIAAEKRASQESLRREYQSQANEASALANYFEDLLSRLAYTPPSTGTGFGSRSYNVKNTYPKQGNCPNDNNRYGAYGGNVCQCTSYASYKAYEKWGVAYIGTYVHNKTGSGHAYNYIYAGGMKVPKNGQTTYVDNKPEAYTIAVDTSGTYGHVMWVESVNADGTINTSEYNVNWPAKGCVKGGFCSRINVGTKNMSFVHFQK